MKINHCDRRLWTKVISILTSEAILRKFLDAWVKINLNVTAFVSVFKAMNSYINYIYKYHEHNIHKYKSQY